MDWAVPSAQTCPARLAAFKTWERASLNSATSFQFGNMPFRSSVHPKIELAKPGLIRYSPSSSQKKGAQMNLCRNGHDKDKVGTVPRSNGRVALCRSCLNDSRAKYNEARKQKRSAKGKRTRMSDTERLERRRERDRQARIARGLAERMRTRDGFEDDYGPVPKPVLNRDWFDWVVAERLLSGTAPGRNPTKLEWAEFFRRNTRVQLPLLVEVTGLNPETIGRHARDNNYTWPYELTGAVQK